MLKTEFRFTVTGEHRDSGVWHGWLLKKYLLTIQKGSLVLLGLHHWPSVLLGPSTMGR